MFAKHREIECRVLDGTEIENLTGKSVFNWLEPVCGLKNLKFRIVL